MWTFSMYFFESTEPSGVSNEAHLRAYALRLKEAGWTKEQAQISVAYWTIEEVVQKYKDTALRLRKKGFRRDEPTFEGVRKNFEIQGYVFFDSKVEAQSKAEVHVALAQRVIEEVFG